MAQQDTITHIAIDDLVKPLVAEAVQLYKEVLENEEDARSRRVDPRKSPAVAKANARLNGACIVLARMWQLLGVDPAVMDQGRARRVVIAQHEAETKAVSEARTADPAIHIEMSTPFSGVGHILGLPKEHEGIEVHVFRTDGVWTAFAEGFGDVQGPSMEETLGTWARDRYGIAHGRATGESEFTGELIDFCW